MNVTMPKRCKIVELLSEWLVSMVMVMVMVLAACCCEFDMGAIEV
jgi:hypothetical protein